MSKSKPPAFNEEKRFEIWRTEVEMWQEICEVAEEKQGVVLALSLPANDKSRIREQVMEELSLAQLKVATGVSVLLDFMATKIGNRPTNPKGPDGRYLTCYGCGSYRHLLTNCPYAYEKDREVGKAENVKAVSDENVVLFTGYDKEEVGQLGEEGMGCAVLDTACTSTVCGTRWMDGFLQTLSPTGMQNIKHEAPYRVFKFGGGEKLKSQMNCTIPCRLGNRDVLIKTDVVESDIPLLLSLKALKTAKVKLDVHRDVAEIFGEEVPLNFTSSGHYCVPVTVAEVKVEDVMATKLCDMSNQERKHALLKLHRQFAHPPRHRLEAIIKDAGA